MPIFGEKIAVFIRNKQKLWQPLRRGKNSRRKNTIDTFAM
jgi:hypothetical protein